MIKIIVNKSKGLPLTDDSNFTFTTLNKGRKEDLEELQLIKSMNWVEENRYSYLLRETKDELNIQYKVYLKLSPDFENWTDKDPTKTQKMEEVILICVEKIREYRLSNLLDK